MIPLSRIQAYNGAQVIISNLSYLNSCRRVHYILRTIAKLVCPYHPWSFYGLLLIYADGHTMRFSVIDS